ncbi:MAG: GHKL domain-containing protein [Lachnospiraceae bacterium]|nr:GHKL domain-containing protein [Lachnospiraceae bacterium]
MERMYFKHEEHLINNVLFTYIIGVALFGWLAVMIFLNGGIRECIFPLSGLCAVITKLGEKKLGRATKYVYACIPPVIGAITNAVCSTPDSESYVSITHYYFVATLLLIPYYNARLLRMNALVTILSNAILLIIFPTGFLKLHPLIGWIYNGFFYIILYVACNFISKHSIFLFRVIEQEARSVKSFENQLEVMRESQDKFHALRHDMKHHLQGIYAMAQKEENQDVLNYLEQMQNSLVNPKEYVKTGNQKMDAIINYSLSKAERFNIKVEQHLKVSRKIALEAYELNIILGNLLENAIEAANDSCEKYIHLHILENKGMLIIDIKNSYSGKLVTYGERLLSTKQGANHGYGLANVRKIVESHHGTLHISYDEKEFHVEVTLYL